jgi:TolB-like protein/tetratricopeptide (TPR) repeat protein
MAKHAMEMVPSIRITRPSVPEEMEEAIFAAMEKNVADRPKTAADFCEILGTPLGATATRRVTGRHTARHRVPTGARMPAYTAAAEAEAPPKVPLYKRPVVVGSAVLGGLALIAGVWSAFSGPPASAAVGSAFSEKKVAVLYFNDNTGGKLGYLADGLTETLIDQLKQVRELEVLSKDAVGRFRGKTVSTDSIIGVLEPGTIVKGSVSEDADKIRVSVNVIDGNSGGDKGDPLVLTLASGNDLAISQTVTDSVSAFLRRLIGAQISLNQLEAGTDNQEAFSKVTRAEKLRKDGLAIATSDSAGGWLRYAQAESLLTQAEALEKKWVSPVALRAVLSLTESRSAKTPILKAPYIDKGIAQADRALKLDSMNVDALEARGQLRFARWQTQLDDKPVADRLLDGAKADLERATEIESTRTSSWVTLSSVYAQLHDQFSSYESAKKAYELDAYAANVEGVLRQMYATAYDIQQFTQAQKHCDEGARRFPRNWRFVSCKLIMRGTGKTASTPDSAWALLQQMAVILPENERELQLRRHQMFVAAILGRHGLLDSARHVIDSARTADPKIDPTGTLLTSEALSRLALGTASDTAVAFQKLREYVVGQPLHGKGFADTDHWWWKDLRKDRRWQQLRVGTGS